MVKKEVIDPDVAFVSQKYKLPFGSVVRFMGFVTLADVPVPSTRPAVPVPTNTLNSYPTKDGSEYLIAPGPFALTALTATNTLRPASASVIVYEAEVAPGMSYPSLSPNVAEKLVVTSERFH
jgi:hypothetical protein